MRAPKATTLLSGFIALLVAGAVWFYLAPVALGGSTSYVVTDGVSMEPRFHAGDLVLVRSQSSYRVGEIVAYRNTMLHTIVLHRIVGRSGRAYLFKGDNNDFIDPDHPLRSQLVGALWLHVAGAGSVLESLRSPLAVGLLVGLGTLFFCGGAFARRRRRKRRRSAAVTSRPPPPTAGPVQPGALGSLIAAGLVVLLAFAALAALSFTRAPAAVLPFSVHYSQTGAFSYTADAHPGPVYPRNRVVTGAPVFTRVVDAVNVRFAYALHAPAARFVRGKIALYATITSTSGWQQTITLERPTAFAGERALAVATLDVRAVTRLISAIEAATSVSGQYTLTLAPRVSATGSLDGLPLHASYGPTLPFSLSQFELERDGPAASPTLGAPAVATPIDPASSGSVTGRRVTPQFLALAFARLSVATGRWVAVGGCALALLALLVMLALSRGRRRDETAAVRARHDRSIVPVRRVKPPRRLATIDVADLAALARIAERYDRVILHETGATGEAYWVADESAQYRYAITPPGSGAGAQRSAGWRARSRARLLEITAAVAGK